MFYVAGRKHKKQSRKKTRGYSRVRDVFFPVSVSYFSGSHNLSDCFPLATSTVTSTVTQLLLDLHGGSDLFNNFHFSTEHYERECNHYFIPPQLLHLFFTEGD